MGLEHNCKKMGLKTGFGGDLRGVLFNSQGAVIENTWSPLDFVNVKW